MKFILASQNRHKLVEMQDILSAHGVEVVLQGDVYKRQLQVLPG